MIFEVALEAFMEGQIRKVEVPNERVEGKSRSEVLDLVFMYGQNDFQPQNMCSVSVGDVIHYNGERFEVAMLGFKKLSQDETQPLQS